MADTTQGDTDGQYPALLVPALIALIAGLLIHSFIIGVNVTDWWKGRSVTPVDHIVTSLGISRMGIQCATTLYLFLDTIFESHPDSRMILHIMDMVFDFFIYANLWLTSLLSIVLCLKICNLHTRLFLYLRGMIEHRTGYLIGASGLLSALNSLISFLLTITKDTDGRTYNTTILHLSMDCTYIYSIYNYTIGTFIPLLFYGISSVLLFTSLYHHTTKMKMSSNLSINLETYYSVMKLVCFTFTYNTLYFFGYISCAFYYFFLCECPAWLHIVLAFLPVLHSSYLIYRTAKLRSQMSKVLQNVIEFLLQSKDAEIRENIEVVA